MAKSTGEPGWKYRRWLIFPVVAYCLYELDQLRTVAVDTKVAEALVYTHGMLTAVMVLGYTGFATFQDIAAIWRTRSGLPYSPEVSAKTDQNEPPEGYGT